MQHRADIILDTVVTLLAAVPGMPGGFKRARAYPHEEESLPAGSIYMGTDDPTALGSSGFNHVDSLLTVKLQVAVKGLPEAIDAELLRIRRDITLQIMADPHLGLAYIVDTTEGRADEPQMDSEGRKPVTWQELTYLVHYRRSREDPAQ